MIIQVFYLYYVKIERKIESSFKAYIRPFLKVQALDSSLVEKIDIEMEDTMENTNRCSIGSWFMGNALSQVLNDNGHEVRLWGNIQEQIDEINRSYQSTLFQRYRY